MGYGFILIYSKLWLARVCVCVCVCVGAPLVYLSFPPPFSFLTEDYGDGGAGRTNTSRRGKKQIQYVTGRVSCRLSFGRRNNKNRIEVIAFLVLACQREVAGTAWDGHTHTPTHTHTHETFQMMGFPQGSGRAHSSQV